MANENENDGVFPARRLMSGRTPPITKCGAMLSRYWKQSGLAQEALAKLAGVKPAMLSAYMHHAQVAPLEVMSALQKKAGWTDDEILTAHTSDTEARAKWAARGRKVGARKAAEARRAEAQDTTKSSGPIGEIIADAESAEARADRFVREVFGLPKGAKLPDAQGRVALFKLRDAVLALLMERP